MTRSDDVLTLLVATLSLIFNQFICTLTCLLDDFSGISFSFVKLNCNLLVCFFKVFLGALRRCQTVSNFLLTLFNSVVQWWPYEFHRKPHEHDHRDRLTYQSCVDIHNEPPLSWLRGLLCKRVSEQQ